MLRLPAPLRLAAILTVAPMLSARSSSRRCRSRSTGAAAVFFAGGLSSRATARSVSRTDQPFSTTMAGHAALLAPWPAAAARARGPFRYRRPSACPAPAWPIAAGAAGWTRPSASGRRRRPPPGGSCRIRRSAAAGRPPPRADSDPRAGCSRSATSPARPRRGCRGSVPALRDRPAICEARQRRSPAMIS